MTIKDQVASDERLEREIESQVNYEAGCISYLKAEESRVLEMMPWERQDEAERLRPDNRLWVDPAEEKDDIEADDFDSDLLLDLQIDAMQENREWENTVPTVFEWNINPENIFCDVLDDISEFRPVTWNKERIERNKQIDFSNAKRAYWLGVDRIRDWIISSMTPSDLENAVKAAKRLDAAINQFTRNPFDTLAGMQVELKIANRRIADYQRRRNIKQEQYRRRIYLLTLKSRVIEARKEGVVD